MEKTRITIRKKIILPLIVSLAALFGLFAFAGCSDSFDSVEDFANSLGGKYIVTYDYQGGEVNSRPSVMVALTETHNYAPEPGIVDNDRLNPAYTGHSLRDFCLAETDENGNVVYDSNGRAVPSDKVWDFKTPVTENITLCARWWTNYKIVLHYGEDFADTAVTTLARTRDGSLVGGEVQLPSASYTVTGNTFIEYYPTAEASTVIDPADVTVTIAEEDKTTNADDKLTVDIYGKSLVGTYRVVRQQSDWTFRFTNSTNIYLMTDIDMSKVNEKEFPTNYSGTFLGNGYSLYNINLDLEPAGRLDTEFGLFQALESGAVIDNVKFKDVVLNINLSNPTIPNYTVGMFAGRVAENVKVTAVKMENVTYGYKIAAAYNFDNVHLGELVGEFEHSGDSVDVQVSELTVKAPRYVETVDGKYRVYLLYSETNGKAKLEEVYGLAMPRSSDWSAVNISKIEKTSDNTYVLTRQQGNRSTLYTVTVTVSDSNEFSVAVESTVVDNSN